MSNTEATAFQITGIIIGITLLLWGLSAQRSSVIEKSSKFAERLAGQRLDKKATQKQFRILAAVGVIILVASVLAGWVL